jgi:uncharacterized protein (DUF488 family)
MNDSAPVLTIFTIGHSTRPVNQFAELLLVHDIKLVVDVRTIPRSRQNPQYNIESLPQTLNEYGIVYEHMPGLGGLRHAKKDSLNSGWENASFRGFADYMQTPEFSESLGRLVDRARTGATAIMCAEAVPWRCHRSLIGDALLVRGIIVKDIIGKGSAREHSLTPWAKVEGVRITYPGAEETGDRKQRG